MTSGATLWVAVGHVQQDLGKGKMTARPELCPCRWPDRSTALCLQTRVHRALITDLEVPALA